MTGHGPPPNVPPQTLVAYLKGKPRPSDVVAFPNETLKGTPWERVRIIVPAVGTHGEAQLAAHKRMRDELKIPQSEWQSATCEAILGDLTAKELLARVVFSEKEIAPGQWARLFATSQDVEQCLSADEVVVLFSLMQEVFFRIGPRLMVLTDSEVDAWVETLKAGFDPLAYMESRDLGVLIRGFHRRIVAATSTSAISLPQDSQQSTWPDTLESASTTYATVTSSFGEQPEMPPDGSSELLSAEDARAIALQMSGALPPVRR